MKKIFALLLAVSMLLMSAAAFAEDATPTRSHWSPTWETSTISPLTRVPGKAS